MDIHGHSEITEDFVFSLIEILKKEYISEEAFNKDAIELGQWLSDVCQVLNLGYMVEDFDLVGRAESYINVIYAKTLAYIRRLKRGYYKKGGAVHDFFLAVLNQLDEQKILLADYIDNLNESLKDKIINGQVFTPFELPNRIREDLYENYEKYLYEWIEENIDFLKEKDIAEEIHPLIDDLLLFVEFEKIEEHLKGLRDDLKKLVHDLLSWTGNQNSYPKNDRSYLYHESHSKLIQIMEKVIFVLGGVKFAIPQPNTKGKERISEKGYLKICDKHIRYSPDFLHMDRPGEPDIEDLNFTSDTPSIYPYLKHQRDILISRLYSLEKDGFARFIHKEIFQKSSTTEPLPNEEVEYLYSEIGAILHTVQDFFSHSNFVEHAITHIGTAGLIDAIGEIINPVSIYESLINAKDYEDIKKIYVPNRIKIHYLQKRLLHFNSKLSSDGTNQKKIDEYKKLIHEFETGDVSWLPKEEHVVSGFFGLPEYSALAMEAVIGLVLTIFGLEVQPTIDKTFRRGQRTTKDVVNDLDTYFVDSMRDFMEGILDQGQAARNPGNLFKDLIFESLDKIKESTRTLSDRDSYRNASTGYDLYWLAKEYNELRKLLTDLFEKLDRIKTVFSILKLAYQVLARKNVGAMWQLLKYMKNFNKFTALTLIEYVVIPETIEALKINTGMNRVGSHGLMAKDKYSNAFQPEAYKLAGIASTAIMSALLRLPSEGAYTEEQKDGMHALLPNWEKLITHYIAHPVFVRGLTKTERFIGSEIVTVNKDHNLDHSLESITTNYENRCDIPFDVLNEYQRYDSPITNRSPSWELIADVNYFTNGLSTKNRISEVNKILKESGDGFKVQNGNYEMHSGLYLEVPYVKYDVEHSEVDFYPWWRLALEKPPVSLLQILLDSVKRSVRGNNITTFDSKYVHLMETIGYEFIYHETVVKIPIDEITKDRLETIFPSEFTALNVEEIWNNKMLQFWNTTRTWSAKNGAIA
jgi:hypothetical protein